MDRSTPSKAIFQTRQSFLQHLPGTGHIDALESRTSDAEDMPAVQPELPLPDDQVIQLLVR